MTAEWRQATRVHVARRLKSSVASLVLVLIACLWARAGTTSWEGHRYAFAKGRLPACFDARFDIVPRSKPIECRVLVNYQDPARLYRIDITGEEIAIVKVAGEMERVLAQGRTGAQGLARCPVVVRRRQSELTVIIEGTQVATAYDCDLQNGSLGFGALRDSVKFGSARIQKVAPIYFSDDFMRGKEERGQWERVSGQWQINAVDNVGFSRNAFSFSGAGGAEPALVVTGEWFWDDYSFSASCSSRGNAFGLVFYYRNEWNYHLLRWSNEGEGSVGLVRYFRGTRVTIAERKGKFITDQWYRLTVETQGRSIRAYIDGNPVLEAEDDNLCLGRAGLYVERSAGTLFDDVAVESTRRLVDEFRRNPAMAWAELGGRWGRKENGGYVVSADGAAKSVAEIPAARNYTAHVRTASWEGQQVGVVYDYLDESLYHVFRAARDRTELVTVRDGRETVLATGSAVLDTRAPHTFSVSVQDGAVVARLDGEWALEWFDETLEGGKVGVYARAVESAVFDRVEVYRHKEPRRVRTAHQVFSHEKSMANWAAAQSDWQAFPAIRIGASAAAGFGPPVVQWHRAEFPGDVRLRIRPQAAGSVWRIGLIMSGRRGRVRTGYAAVLTARDKLTAELLREGKTVATVERPIPGHLASVSLRRAGGTVVACVNGRPVLKFADHAPSSETAIGWFGDGLSVRPEAVEIFSDNVLVYPFERAPCLWRIAGGRWGVSNRWQCDPRWSFFSGVSNGVAAIWNKRIFEGDVSVEFAAGIKMERERGRRYEYARDINVTICADGKNLTTGYSFIFGGWRNSRTCILRGNQIVAQTRSAVIPRLKTSIHRRWFYLKAEKKGKRLRFWLDNELILQYTDEAPLKGNRVAIWTYNVGIMLARVRVSAQRVLGLEDAFATYPQPTLCCYDRPGPAQVKRAPPRAPVRLSRDAQDKIEQARLWSVTGNRKYIPHVAAMLAHESDEVRWEASLALVRFGKAAVPAIINALNTSHVEARWKAEAALARIGQDAVPAVQAALSHESVFVRRSAAYVLGQLRSDTSIEPLAAALADADEQTRWKAATSLTRFGTKAADVVAPILSHGSPEARRCAAWFFQKAPNPGAIPGLAGNLAHADQGVRWKAAIALREIGQPAVAALRAVLDQDAEVAQKYAAWALGEIGGEQADQALTRYRKTQAAKPRPRATAAQQGRPGAGAWRSARVQLTSDPPGATVVVNDKYVGVTPLGLDDLAAGAYVLKLTRHGYLAWTDVVEVGTGRQGIHADLKREARGLLAVASKPEAARVYVDGTFAGRTPVRMADLVAGQHQVRVAKNGYVSWEGTAEVKGGGRTDLSLRLKSRMVDYYLARIEKDPTSAQYSTELAHLYVLEGRFEEAAQALGQAMRLVASGRDTSAYEKRVHQELRKMYLPTDFDYGGTAEVRELRRRLESAMERLIRESPRDFKLHMTLGKCYCHSGKMSDAERVLRTAASLAPRDANPDLELGRAYLSKGDRRQARRCLDAAARKARDSRTRGQIQRLLRQARR